MEIAEWLQMNWYTTNSKQNKTKLLTYINKIKREKKFNGENIYKLNDRGLKVLAQRYLGLRKGDNDYKIFINRIRELQTKYSAKYVSRTPRKRNNFKSSSNKQDHHKRNKSQELFRDSRERSRTFPHSEFAGFQQQDGDDHDNDHDYLYDDDNDHDDKKKQERELKTDESTMDQDYDHNKSKNNKKGIVAKHFHPLNRAKSHKLKHDNDDPLFLKKKSQDYLSSKSYSFNHGNNDENDGKIKNKKNKLKIDINNNNKTSKRHNRKSRLNQVKESKLFASSVGRIKSRKKRGKQRNKEKQLKLTIHDEKSNKINRRKNKSSKTWNIVEIEKEREKYTKKHIGLNDIKEKKRRRRKEKEDNNASLNDRAYSETIKSKKRFKRKNKRSLARMKTTKSHPTKSTTPTPQGKKLKRREKTTKLSKIKEDKFGLKIRFESKSPKRKSKRSKSQKRPNSAKHVNNDTDNFIILPQTNNHNQNRNRRNGVSVKNIRNDDKINFRMRIKRNNKCKTPKTTSKTISSQRGNTRNKRSISSISPKKSHKKKSFNHAYKQRKKYIKPNNGAIPSSAKSCPPTYINNDTDNNNNNNNLIKYNGYENLGLVILENEDEDDDDNGFVEEEEEEEEENKDNLCTGTQKLQFSVTSPAGSPSPGSKHIPKYGSNSTNSIRFKYEGVTAEELLQLFSYGHNDEIDTDYDTDTNTYINTDYNEYISETPSPKDIRFNGNGGCDDDESFTASYTIHRLQLLSSNSANLSNVSTSISSLHSSHNGQSFDNNNYNNYHNEVLQGLKTYKPKHFRFSDHNSDDGTSYILSDNDELSDNHLSPKNHHNHNNSNTNNTTTSLREIPLFDGVTSGSMTNGKHTTMVIPSIFAIDDTDSGNGDDAKFPPKIALSPIISSDTLKSSENRGLLLNMMCYSMTDESTDEEDNNYLNHRNSTVKQTMQTSKRIIDYALHNSPPTQTQTATQTVTTQTTTTPTPTTPKPKSTKTKAASQQKQQSSSSSPSPFDVIDLNNNDDNNNNNNNNCLPNTTTLIPQLTTSQTGLAVLDDIADFVNDSGSDDDDDDNHDNDQYHE